VRLDATSADGTGQAYDRRMRVAVPLRQSYKLINHGPTTLISAAAGGRANAMAAAWVMALDFEPPKIAGVIAADTFTRSLVDASGELVVQVPVRDQLDLVYALGTQSGKDGAKLARLGVRTEPASLVAAPLVAGCAAWLECRVLPEPGIQERYDLFVCEVVAAWADDEVVQNGEWRFASAGKRSLHHLSKGVFLTIGERVEARRP
jgi:flavin reductase (DIM6/NTAB) family NADH-FMN oxidoreductase RutF